MTTAILTRVRLPNRRLALIETLEAAGQVFDAAVGFDLRGQPRELFLKASKEGSMLNALLADAAVVISVALQHGVPAEALSKSVGRLPGGVISPTDLDRPQPEKLPASPIGAALDYVTSLDRGAGK